MITRIELENYKAFENAKIDIKPITILVGPNNGGKSTILQSINLVKQTLLGSSAEVLKFKGDLDLGDFDTILHQNSEKQEIRLRFEFEEGKYFETNIAKEIDGKIFVKDFKCNFGDFENILENIGEEKGNEEKECYLPETFSFNSKLFQKNITKTFDPIFYRENFWFILSPSELDYAELNEFLENYGKIINKLEKSKNNKDRDYVESKVEYFKELRTYLSLEKKQRDFYQDIKQIFEKIKYIGPIRVIPSRYYQIGFSYDNVGPAGEHAVHMIEANEKLLRDTKNVMNSLEIIKDIEVSKLPEQKTFEFKVKTKITDKGVNLSDVGCGTSQILPIIVQSSYSKDASMIIIEQPETHLHPKVQADLASFIIELGLKTTFLIETHSEYFIERIRTHIMKNPKLADDVVIYYIEPNEDQKRSEITKIEINSKGQYPELPEGYLVNFKLEEIDEQMDLMLGKIKETIKKD